MWNKTPSTPWTLYAPYLISKNYNRLFLPISYPPISHPPSVFISPPPTPFFSLLSFSAPLILCPFNSPSPLFLCPFSLCIRSPLITFPYSLHPESRNTQKRFYNTCVHQSWLILLITRTFFLYSSMFLLTSLCGSKFHLFRLCIGHLYRSSLPVNCTGHLYRSTVPVTCTGHLCGHFYCVLLKLYYFNDISVHCLCFQICLIIFLFLYVHINGDVCVCVCVDAAQVWMAVWYAVSVCCSGHGMTHVIVYIFVFR